MFTVGAASAIGSIIDAFPTGQRERINTQLSTILQAIVSQQLVHTLDDSLLPVFQFMTCNNEIRRMIREGDSSSINQAISSYKEEGMISMDEGLLKLFKDGRITARDALARAIDADSMARYINSTDKIYF
jgi:twitching motility protein PilT